MAQGDFLARIKLALEGKEQVVSGLAETQRAAQKLSTTKVKTIFDKQGLVTGTQIEQTFKKMSPEIQKTTQGTNDFVKALRRAAIVAPVWLALRAVMMSTLQLIKEQLTFLKDLETAMARIQIVGKGTAEEYNNLKISLVALSVSYGTVASEAMKAAVIFAQQGHTVADTIKLTRTAMIATQVLGQDIQSVVNNMTAAVKGFNIPVQDSISIIDKWINVERQFAVTSKDLADATKVVGATANQMGISINSFIGHVAAVIEVTRKSGSEAGRGLQFVYARLLTTGKKVIEQIAKIPVYLDKQGKSTFEMTQTYRSASDVLDDLGAKWETLTNKERLEIAQQVASKRQLTVFMALMQNYNKALDARIAALASAGQAERAFGIIQETLTIKLNRLSAAWNNLTVSIGDTSAFKKIIDIATEFINRWAAIINIQQAYRSEAVKVKDEHKKMTETQISQLQSLKELIELRDQYINAPKTEANIEMLKKINTAIDQVKENGKITLNINDKDILIKIKDIVDKVRRQDITWEVNVDFDIEKKILEKELKELQARHKFTPFQPSKWTGKDKAAEERIKRISELEAEIVDLSKKQTDEKEKQLNIYDTELTKKEAIKSLSEDELSDTEDLTMAEEEKINLANALNTIKGLGLLTSEQMLDYEKKLVEQSNFQYDAHAKALKLSELESQRLNSRLDDARKMTDEMLKQNQASAHLVDLYKIARKYGKQTAQEVAQYQGGAKTFGELSSTAKEALKKYNKGAYEQGMAQEYFRGTGFRFPEQIEAGIRNQLIEQNFNYQTNVPIAIDVTLDPTNFIDQLKQEINKELDNNQSEISQAINKKIGNY